MRRPLSVKLAADRIVHFALGDLQPDLRRRSRLIAAQRLDVGPPLEGAPADDVQIQRRRVASQIAGDLDRLGIGAAHQHLQFVARDDELRCLLPDVVLKLQRRQARPRELDLREVAGPNPLDVDGHQRVERVERFTSDREVVGRERDIDECALNVEHDRAHRVQHLQLGHRARALRHFDPPLALAAALDDHVGAEDVLDRVHVVVEDDPVRQQPVVREHRVRAQARRQDARLRDAHGIALGHERQVAIDRFMHRLVDGDDGR